MSILHAENSKNIICYRCKIKKVRNVEEEKTDKCIMCSNKGNLSLKCHHFLCISCFDL